MKKIILIAAGVILTVSGFAQIKLGLQVTANLASANVKSKYDINFDKGLAGLPGVSAIVAPGKDARAVGVAVAVALPTVMR